MPMFCQHGFIGGDHIFTGGNGCLCCLFCRACAAADQFDKDIHIVPFGQNNWVIFPAIARQIDAAVFAA